MPQRVLVKLSPQGLAVAASAKANLRPLYDEPAGQAAFALSGGPQWHVAEIAGEPNPWDAAHTQVAGALGLQPSALIYAEPDLLQKPLAGYDQHPPAAAAALAFAGVPPSPGFGWHLGDAFSQLRSARTQAAGGAGIRIAHIDTGYDPNHPARPKNILHDLERSFVDGDNNPNSAADPNRGNPLDQSGHGTGTIGVLAGGRVAVPGFDDFIGGAPEADILPIRVANTVVLFWTSALAAGLRWAIQQKCDVITLSMGGLPSRAWRENVNLAYESGICLVAASGDCFGGFPTHHVVYPARYKRVVCACGAMSNLQPYYGLPPTQLEGNWGPASSMTAAVAAFTPHIPWPTIQTTQVSPDGDGTSAATPQIAAAAALWLEQHRPQLPEPWMRAEAVRQALFTSAQASDAEHFGRGLLKAADVLRQPVSPGLVKAPEDDDSFAFLRVITGLGLTDGPAREAMFNLELQQLWQTNRDLQAAIPDPDAGGGVSRRQLGQFLDAAIADPAASEALKKHLRSRAPDVAPGPVPAGKPLRRAAEVARPATRRLRAYAFDPSLGLQLRTAAINETVLEVPWENLAPGPCGAYLEVVDYDPASQAWYAVADLNDPYVLARTGFDPSETDPRFHQQMVYAVAMNTIAHFERALGRVIFWRPQPNPDDPFDDSRYVARLRIYPHALRQANAYYSPEKVSLLFGYFQTSAEDSAFQLPDGAVFTCLSHDIVAHETTHALLDGMHRRFNEPSNPDVLAFHEAFADIVALFQHFTIPEVLRSQIAQTRGDLESESLLGGLALQFGRATGSRGALRSAIGKLVVENGRQVWKKLEPNPADYQTVAGTHERGALLVAAVFDAYIRIYRERTRDLFRIYTKGTGVLPPGEIHPDLVNRLAGEAAKSAEHILTICIRALDYLPPVDITFGEYLRGIVTADAELVADDPFHYRVAFVEAFQRRGICPRDLRTVSVDSLKWSPATGAADYAPILPALALIQDYISQSRDLDRQSLFELSRDYRIRLHRELAQTLAAHPDLADALGLDPELLAAHAGSFEVHSLRQVDRIGPDGQRRAQVILVLTQSRGMDAAGASFPFRGGCTLVLEFSPRARQAPPQIHIRYAITKRIGSQSRQQQTRSWLAGANRPLWETYFGANVREPFAFLHNLAGGEDYS